MRSLVPVDALCEEVEQRNRLRLLTPFLEQLVAEGSKDAGVHSALGKILVDSGGAAAGGASSSSSSSAAGTNAEHFLTTNPYYDSRAVGKYCEKRDPHLACVAYRRGQCDDELVRCTTAHSLFKAQARYVVERADAELWAKVLAEGSEGRRPLVDQVVSTALPECRNPEQVSVAVKAFMAAGLQSELIELLEKIVLMANSSFASNHNLQNLLIITAIKSDKARVADYISRLDNFDGPAVGEIAVGYEMFDEAFEIYKKFGLKAQAIKVLLEHGKAGNKAGGDGGAGGESPTSSSSTPAVASPSSLAKADAYAASVDDPAVWAELGHAHLAAGDAAAAIAAYTKAGDGSRLADVVAAATQAGAHGPLIEYLLMARAKAAAGGAPGSLKGDPAAIDSELVRVFFFFFFAFFASFSSRKKKSEKNLSRFFFFPASKNAKKNTNSFHDNNRSTPTPPRATPPPSRPSSPGPTRPLSGPSQTASLLPARSTPPAPSTPASPTGASSRHAWSACASSSLRSRRPARQTRPSAGRRSAGRASKRRSSRWRSSRRSTSSSPPTTWPRWSSATPRGGWTRSSQLCWSRPSASSAPTWASSPSWASSTRAASPRS